MKSKSEKPQDIKNFEALVGLMLSTSIVHPIDFPDDLWLEFQDLPNERRYGHDYIIKRSIIQLYLILHLVRDFIIFE